MELFVYSWSYNGHTVYGHSLDESGEYHLIKVTDFMPTCYVEGETVHTSSTVVPRKAEYKRMLSSKDVSALKPFYRLSFSNMKEMEQFSSGRQPCYMADIPQISMFLSETGADNVGWVRVSTSGPHVERMSGIVGVPNKIPLAGPRVMVFDIEVKSMDSGMPQPHRIADTVEMISVVLFGNNKSTQTYILHAYDEPFGIEGAVDVVCSSETELITKFFLMIKQEDPTVLTGFNIYGFDIHYLVSRLRLRLIEIPDVGRGVSHSIDLIKVDWSSDAYGHNKYDRLVIGGRVIIDMYLYFKRMKLDKYSLQFISGKFLGEGKDDMPYAKMAGAFESGDHGVLREVAQYCIKDSVLVMKLFAKVQMWVDACEVSKITRCSIEDIYTRGEQMKMISQCVAECAERNIVLQPQEQSEWKQYEGAYVLEPTKGVYDNCTILDFQSLYPSIIIAYNICPSTYSKAGANVHKCGDHSFMKEPVGLLPGMIKRILDERKTVKKQMKALIDSEYGATKHLDLEYIVLDRRQNALKICANSVYGMMGFKNSRYFGHVGCAESVTTIGRELLTSIVEKIERTYPVRVVYGDSVTGYTPTIVRIQSEFVFLETFENLATKWGEDEWVESDGKESCELYGVEVWTDSGWTRMHRVIRHTLAPHKKIIRVLTHTGLVDVTDEHSLLSALAEPVSASDVEVGDELLHHPYPLLHETEMSISPNEAKIFGMFCGDGSCGTYDWAINNADMRLLLKYKGLCEEVYGDYTWVVASAGSEAAFSATSENGAISCYAATNTVKSSGIYKLSPRGEVSILSRLYRATMYRKTEKTVPQEVLNSGLEVRQAFWNGLYDADGDKGRIHQITIASFAMLASSIGYNISLNTLDVFRLTVTKATQRRSTTAVKKVHEIDYKGYVYDATTSNHHFQAGPGKMVVHNTDSCMLWYGKPSAKGDVICNSLTICEEITSSLPEPMALNFEAYCDKVILLTKKRYVLVSGNVISYKGVMNARRDYCKYAKDTYGCIMELVAKGEDKDKISEYIDRRILCLLSGSVALEDVVVTKSMAKQLVAYKVNQPHVVLARRLVKKTGVDIPAGTRLEYVYVKGGMLVTPEEFESGSFEIDGRFYVEKQLATQIDDVLSTVGMGNYIKDSWTSSAKSSAGSVPVIIDSYTDTLRA